MNTPHRSGCPINLTLETLGDRWSLIVIRDVMFGNRRHFRELLTQSEEGIASNILADRLKRLVENGLLSRRDDPTHKQKAIYSLTESGIALVPVFAAIGAWGSTYLPVSEAFGARARVLAKGGSRLWKALMNELRETHVGAVTPAQTAGSPRSGGKRARGARSAASARRSRTSPR